MSISSLEMGICSLPFIGSIVSFFRLASGSHENSKLTSTSLKTSSLAVGANFAILTGNQQLVDQYKGVVADKLNEVSGKIKERIADREKDRTYMIFGMVSSGLTVVMLVSLLAMGRLQKNFNNGIGLFSYGTQFSGLFYLKYLNQKKIEKLSQALTAK
jgi:hypothetical protein